MVDPNRKINRLTEEDISFLDECEELFGNRFTEDDEEFMTHCTKPVPEPPIVVNFGGGGGGNSSGNSAQNNSYRGGRYNDHRPLYRPCRGGRGGGNRGYQERHRGDARCDDNYRNHHSYRDNYNRDESGSSYGRTSDVRRDYNNFVSASTNDIATGQVYHG